MFSKEQLDEAIAKHPGVALFSKGQLSVFCRKAQRSERLAFLGALMMEGKGKEQRRATAIEQLVRRLAVLPDAEAVDRMYEDEGFAMDEIGAEVMTWLRGGEDEVEVKKF